MRAFYLASTALVFAGAASAQTITPGQGTLTDAAGNTWAITPSGSVHQGAKWTPGGGGTSALTIVNGTVYGEDAHGRGWFKLSSDGQDWSSAPTPTTTTQPATQTYSHQDTTTASQSSGTQSVAIPPASCGTVIGGEFGILPLSQGGTGQIIDSAGNVFTPRGINIMEGQDPSADTLKGMFPGINFVRYAVYDYAPPDKLAPYVNSLTSAGIVVELENHQNNAGGAGGGQGSVFTGQALSQEQAWYQSIATAFKSNPYVWFGTNNEPPNTPGLSQWQQTTYNTIRSAGNQSIIFLETSCYAAGSQPVCNQGYDPSVYAGMSNVAWDNHIYGWLTNFDTNQTTNDQFVANNVNTLSSIKSAGSVTMPTVVGEYGNSTTGHNIDANGTQIVNSVNKAVLNKTVAGSAAWAWGAGNPGDGLTNGGSLSSYGQQVAGYLAQSAPGQSVCQNSGNQKTQTHTVLAQTGGNDTTQPTATDSQSRAQADTIAAATAASQQAVDEATASVDANLKQIQAIQEQMNKLNANTHPGIQAIGAGIQ